MKKMVTALLLFTSTFSISTYTIAQDREYSIGVLGGSTGAGLQFSTHVTESVSFRASYNVFNYDTDLNSDDTKYEAEFDKDSVSILFDWHVFGGEFHFTGGAYSHGENSLNVNALPVGGNYEFNGVLYPSDSLGSVSGVVGLGKTTPYLGLGWGDASHGKGFSFSLDIGLQFQDSPSVSLTANGCQLAPAACQQLNSDLQAEINDLEKDGEDFEFWPVLNAGILYHF